MEVRDLEQSNYAYKLLNYPKCFEKKYVYNFYEMTKIKEINFSY